MLAIDDERASAKSRVVALRLTLMTLRLMENWQRHFRDPETAVLLLAIAAINGEKLLREDLEHDRQDLRNPMPVDRLTRCNINSIAVATGINRETARRKVNALADAGIVVRNDDGSVNLRSGLSQQPELIQLVRMQLETLNRVSNELVRDGALKIEVQP